MVFEYIWLFPWLNPIMEFNGGWSRYIRWYRWNTLNATTPYTTEICLESSCTVLMFNLCNQNSYSYFNNILCLISLLMRLHRCFVSWIWFSFEENVEIFSQIRNFKMPSNQKHGTRWENTVNKRAQAVWNLWRVVLILLNIVLLYTNNLCNMECGVCILQYWWW